MTMSETPESLSVLETPASCDVKIDNKRVSEEFQSSIGDVQLRQYIDDHHELRIQIDFELFDDQRGGASDLFDSSTGVVSYLGKSISAKITPMGGYVDEGRTLEFIGVVTEVAFDNSLDGRNTAIIIAHSPTISLDGGKHNVQNFDKTASEIIGGILKTHPITLGEIKSTSIKYKYNNQHNETDFEYIHRLAGLEGLFAFYDGKEFALTKASSSNAESLTWGENLGAFRVGIGTVAHEFASKSYNYEQKKTFTQDSASLSAQASLSSMSKVAPEASKEIYKSSGYSNKPRVVEDAQSLDENLHAQRNRAMGSMVKCFGQSDVPSVRVGHPIKVGLLGSLNGPYWVKAVRHIIANGKYHNTFTCSPVDIAYPEKQPSARIFSEASKNVIEQQAVPANPKRDSKPSVLGLHVGVVINNVDPEMMGRVQVQFAWSEADTIWVRMAVPYAGSERGWVSIPEVGDEILIGFEFGDPDYPIGLGCLYNKEAKLPPDTGDADNNIKTFLTRGGNQIVFNDTDGSEELIITMKDGKNQIAMEISGPSVTIKSDTGTINLQAANISLEADQEVKFKAGTMVNLEGINVTIKASGALNLEGGMTTIKGTPIQLN